MLHFFGRGKLLITGEYFVLDCAQSLALPTKLGQHISVETVPYDESNFIQWHSYDMDKSKWLEVTLNKALQPTIENGAANTLARILQVCNTLNPNIFQSTQQSFKITTTLDFNRHWGLGSSSTLIHSLASWFQINPYILLEKTFGGSGYDIACAASDSPILYLRNNIENPTVKKLSLKWNFKDQLYFVYLGVKKNSREGIKHYKEQLQNKTAVITELNKITQDVIDANSLAVFEEAITEHEEIISESLHLKKVKDEFFTDYWGAVKSLGAWGGDFVLMTNNRSEEELKNYLTAKGFNTCFTFSNLII